MKNLPNGEFPVAVVSGVAVSFGLFILILALLKVYLSNQIYHESKKINLIEAEVAALKEENSILQMNVEQLKYKNQITDSIFSMEENKEITDTAEEEAPND